MKFDRRQLMLNALGGGLFLPSVLGDRMAHAAVPKRLFIFHTQHGPNYWDWSMRPPGAGPDTSADWEVDLTKVAESAFSAMLKPLFRHRGDLLVLDGLANTAAFASKGTNNHNAGNATILTGARINPVGGLNGDGTGGDISVDQIIGKAVQVPGRKMTIHATTSGNQSPVFAGSGQEIRAVTNPNSLYLMMKEFNGAMMMGTPGTPVSVDKVALARTTLADLVRPEYDRLITRLSGDDKRKLEGHLALMNDLQQRLVARTPRPGTDGGGTMPGAGGSSGPACNFLKPPQPTSVLEVVDELIKVMVAGLACQVANVAVLVPGQLSGSEIGGGSSDVHQDIAHQSTAPGSNAAKLMRTYYEKHALQFASLLDQLKAIPEGSGTMLDNTVVVWNAQLANGPHDMNRIHTVIAGNGQGYFKTGRYLKYQETYPNPATFGYGGGNAALGPANTKLLVSLMQYMGVERDSIGISSATGANYGSGKAVDLKGPLARLRP